MGRVRERALAMVRVMRRNKGTFALYVVLRLVVVACAVTALVFGNYEAFFLCLLTLVLFLVPPFIEVNFSITIPETLEVVIALFIFAAEILGEVFHFYTIIPFWDTLLHTFNGFLAAAIGLALVSILNRSDRIAFYLSPFFCAVVAFCFSMTIGVLWEFFEFGMDWVFGLDMQKDTIVGSIASVMLDPEGLQRPWRIDGIESVVVNGRDLGLGGYLDIGLIDTMEDLFVNFVGALAFSVIGYRYLKSKGEGTFARRFVPVLSVPEGEAPRPAGIVSGEDGGPGENAEANPPAGFGEPARSGGHGASAEGIDSDKPDTLTI
ncbi:hypothetical protein [Gordonibacter sp. 28C]|uniref:hypothetical protein n=1 Tax=Gordonibacter sp. 28C TaxID=2078569 RepID=UPI001F53F745|nr:hypothetical protein [Gordonibacter sp. 28C]